MWSHRLIWIFGALFVFFGLPLIIVDDNEMGRVLAGLSALSLGGFALALAFNARVTGKITLQFSKISRAARPRTYWAAVSLVAIAGVVVVITGFWAIFFKV